MPMWARPYERDKDAHYTLRYVVAGAMSVVAGLLPFWVSARDPERDFETPIWRQGSRARHRNRVVLPPAEFASALAALQPRRDVQVPIGTPA